MTKRMKKILTSLAVYYLIYLIIYVNVNIVLSSVIRIVKNVSWYGGYLNVLMPLFMRSYEYDSL